MNASRFESWNDRQPRFRTADDFAFSAPQIEAGWLKIRVTCLGKEHDFDGSYLGEPFAGFLSAVLDLHAYAEGELPADGASEFNFWSIWAGEPWRYEWTFWPREEGREVNVRLVYHSDTPRWNGNPKDEVETWFEVCVPLPVLLRQWYEVGRSILMTYGLIGYRNAWIDAEFPLRDFRDLHEAVTGTTFPAVSVEDDIRFLSLFARGAVETKPETMEAQRDPVGCADATDSVPAGRVFTRASLNGQALLAHWDEEYQELKADADRKRNQGTAPCKPPRVPPDQGALVFVVDPDKTPVLACRVDRRHAAAFAVARAKDFGEPYSYRIVD